MIKRPILLMIALLAVLVLPVLAQDSGGQFWVQAFEDRNGNGQHDPGEPFLTSGVSVDLLNADGVVMASVRSTTRPMPPAAISASCTLRRAAIPP